MKNETKIAQLSLVSLFYNNPRVPFTHLGGLDGTVSPLPVWQLLRPSYYHRTCRLKTS